MIDLAGVELDDGAPAFRREESMGSRRHCQSVDGEEAAYALDLEAGGLTAQRPFRHGGFSGRGEDQLVKEHDHPQQLVGFPRGRTDEAAALVPVDGRSARPLAAAGLPAVTRTWKRSVRDAATVGVAPPSGAGGSRRG